MTKAIPISLSTLKGKHWRNSTDYLFAANRNICPLDYTEIAAAALYMPTGFVKSSQDYHLIAIHGLSNDTNLFVDSVGKWLSDYLPLEYRFYPFLLAHADDGRMTLCVDEDSGLVTEAAEGHKFFEGDEPAPLVTSIMDALTARQRQRLQTQNITKQLAEQGLITKWNLSLKIDGEDRQISGLYCGDESAISKLSGEQLIALRDSGALALLYCQILSMRHVQHLLKLLNYHSAAKPSIKSEPKGPTRDALGTDSGTLNFDNI